jgi:hypothetical protein
LGCRNVGFDILREKDEGENGNSAGDKGEGENWTEVAVKIFQEQKSKYRPDCRANSIGHLMKAKRLASFFRADRVGNQGVAGSGSGGLAHAVKETHHEHVPGAGGEGENRLYDGGEAVANDRKDFPFMRAIRKSAGEHAQGRSRALGDFFNDPNSGE